MKITTIALLLLTLNSEWVMAQTARNPDSLKPDVVIDFSKPAGKIKGLHGVNGGPFNYGAISAPISGYHAAAGFPHTRLHDANWPNSEAIDIHAIFPLFDADPDDPKNYLFAKSDDYIAPIIKNGSEIVYRLGETIEHFTSYFVNPPKDYAKWTKICINIIRHYNDGWNNGFHYNIKYWEIWNEPENRAMWKGTHLQYFQLYESASKAIKAYNSSLKVGGPGAVGQGSDFVKDFLGYCRDKALPLDFFSWHMYSDDPYNMDKHARHARALLDEYGFKKTENHINEWHYFNGSDLFPNTDQNLERYSHVEENFRSTIGPAGAAFSASVLTILQDSYVDVANFYCADYYNALSMFSLFGVPSKVYYAFKAFNQLYKSCNNRVTCTPIQKDTTIYILAGLSPNKDTAGILVSNFSKDYKKYTIGLNNLFKQGGIYATISQVDEFHDLDLVEMKDIDMAKPVLELRLLPNSVYLVKLCKSRK